MTNFWGAVLNGAITALNGRSERRGNEAQANAEGVWGVRRVNAQANQDRDSLLYEMQLKEWERQNRRKEVARGGRNYAQFATVPQGYRNLAPMDGTPAAMPTPTTRNYSGE